jgi:hypothetical protein
VEISSDALLAMTDEQLHVILVQLGITLPRAWSRDKMLDLILKVASSARDS